MKQSAKQAKASEAEAIMFAGGFTEAHAEHFGPWWRVRGVLADGDEHSGVTHLQADPQDPSAMARVLVAKLTPREAAEPAPEPPPVDGYESAEAIATEAPLFAPEDDPFGLPLAENTEEVESLGDEGNGETGEETSTYAASTPENSGYDPETEELTPSTPEYPIETTGLPTIQSEFEAEATHPVDALDADFTDLPALTDESLGADILAAEEESASPQDRFYGLDDLDRRRSLRIGDVVRLSRSKQVDIAVLMGEHDFASIQNAVLRDTVDGVYRGQQATYDLFVELSRHQNAIARVRLVEADKVAFLEGASREEVEAFDPADGWP